MFRAVAVALTTAARRLSPTLVATLSFTLISLAPATAKADVTDVRLRVVFYPASVAAPSDGSKPSFTAADVRDDILNQASQNVMAAYPLYVSCVYDIAKPVSSGCDPTTANVLVTTQFTSASTQPARANASLLVTMRSFDVVNGRVIGTVSLPSPDLSEVKPGDADTLKAALALLVPTNGQLAALLGTATISDNRLSLFQGYEPYVQLVPTLTNSNDPTYLALLANLLDRRGIPSIPSQFNAGVVSSGSTPINTICGRGQRYLVYNLSSEDYPHTANFSTRIQTHANAQLYDCTTMSVIPVGLDQHVSVLTTKGPLTSLIAIVQAAFFSTAKSVSPVPLTVAGLVSPFVDAVPDSDTVRHGIADRALQGLVDGLCAKLEAQPTPAPVPAAPPIVVRVARSPAPAANAAALARARANDVVNEKLGELKGVAARGTRAMTAEAIGNFSTAMHALADTLPAVGSAAATKRKKAEVNGIVNDATKKLQSASKSPTGLQRKTIDVVGTTVHARVAALTTPAGSAPTSSGSGDQGAAASSAAQPASSGGASLVSLDVSGFLAATPPPLKCTNGQKIDQWSGTAADPGRWKQP